MTLFPRKTGVLCLAALLVTACGREGGDSPKAANRAPRPHGWIAEREQQMGRTIWAKEILAEQCGGVFAALWDSMNIATNPLAVAAAFPVGQVRLGQWSIHQDLPHGIQFFRSTNSGPTLPAPEWQAFLQEAQRDGWRLSQTEFRHRRFDVDSSGQPRQSGFYFSAHLTNGLGADRVSVDGDLIVDWAPMRPGQPPAVARIDASQLTAKRRSGPLPFELALDYTFLPPEKAPWIDPLIAQDLDGDGLPEIILLAANRVYHRAADGSFHPTPLLQHPPELIYTGVIADFNGDGIADLLCVVPTGLMLYRGTAGATFSEPGELVWAANPRLVNPMALTCGDIDGDGDLDVFFGQYRVPTLGQNFKPSYADANDGHPSYLLLNNGDGHFTNATAASGLGQKRARRVFSTSFVDLDNDGHLDLVVVSDFAGLDLYRNDGAGHFTDVTREWVKESRAFGMSQVAADFNRDGRLDLLMIGMNSPTVDRLNHLGLLRSGLTDEASTRTAMTYGNRLYLARPEGGFQQSDDSIARSGWSWGCAAFDWDNDGYPDVYIGNGQDSRTSVREYEPLAWLHNFYINDPDDGSVSRYLMDEYDRTRAQGWSYGGYEKNRLYWNRDGVRFTDVAPLAGVALEDDTRAVVSVDVDGDGRMDLALITRERWPGKHETLRVYRNVLEAPGNWIGFHLRDGPGHPSTGARVTVRAGVYSSVRQSVAGDSFRSQQSSLIHFGLGSATAVDAVDVRWPDGTTCEMKNPAPNRYHELRWPGERPGTSSGAP